MQAFIIAILLVRGGHHDRGYILAFQKVQNLLFHLGLGLIGRLVQNIVEYLLIIDHKGVLLRLLEMFRVHLLEM
jgi:hypothetical protein